MAVIGTDIEGRTEAGEDELPLERLEVEIIGWSGNLAAATAQLLEWIGEYDRREGWKQWGCRSMAQWLSWKCGESLHTAREKVRVARALEELPLIRASLRAGEIGYSKVRAITRVACPADDGEWLNRARHSTGSELDRIVSAVKSALERDENRDARRAFERRRVRQSTREDGLAEIRIVGPPDSIAAVWAAIEIESGTVIDDAVNGSGRSRWEVTTERGGLEAVRYDAVERLAERTVAASPAAAERGDIGRLQLVIDTDFVAEVADAADTTDGECTLAGARVAPEVALRWSCDIRASAMLEHEGHVHDEGHNTRTPNRRLRRALHRRDGGACRFPGCAATKWLHAHHIVHWAKGGATDLENLVSLCGFHHHLVHEGGWSVDLVEGAVVWSDPDGVPTGVEPLEGDADRVAAQGVPAGTVEPTWHNDRLDFAYVVAVITDHCARVRKRPRGDAVPV